MHRIKTKVLAFAMAGSIALSMSGFVQPVMATAASTDVVESTITQSTIESVSIDITRPVYGDTITATVVPSGADVTYQWYNSDGLIEGAIDQTYTPTADDVEKELSVYVEGTGAYDGNALAQTETVVQNNKITGVSLDIPRPTYGDTITAMTVPANADATYQWYNSDGKIEGATEKSYKPTAEDVMKHLRVYVKGVYGYTGSVNVRTTAPVQRAEITGVSLDVPRPTYGDTITAVTEPEDADATYQWYNSDGKIEGATEKSYTPTSEDVMKHLRVYVKGSGVYTGNVTVRTTAPVQRAAITSVSLDVPRPTYGDTITAVTVPEDADATYQWYNSNGIIEGATGKSYTPTSEDVMKHLRVYVKGANGYTGSVTVRTTAPVQRAAITGVSLDIPRPTYGDTITAVTVPEDADATYQWYNSDGKIDGATDKSYTPTKDDIMKHLRVYVKGSGAYTGSVTVRTTAPVQRGNADEDNNEMLSIQKVNNGEGNFAFVTKECYEEDFTPSDYCIKTYQIRYIDKNGMQSQPDKPITVTLEDIDLDKQEHIFSDDNKDSSEIYLVRVNEFSDPDLKNYVTTEQIDYTYNPETHTVTFESDKFPDFSD